MKENNIIFLLSFCLGAALIWAIANQVKISELKDTNRQLVENREALIKGYGECNQKKNNLFNNFDKLFKFVNDRRYNQGRGVLAGYDTQFQGMSVERVAEMTELNYTFIEY